MPSSSPQTPFYLLNISLLEPALVETEVDAEVDAEAAMEANIAELEESMTELRSNIAVQQAFMTAPEAPAITPPPAPPPPPPTYGGREPEPKKPAPYAKYEAIVLSGVPALTKKQIWEAQQKVVKVDAYREKLHGITRDVEIINR